MSKSALIASFIFAAALSSSPVFAADTITVALTAKAFQYTILPLAQERGYMREEGLELKLVFMQNAQGLQALIANAVQFSGFSAGPVKSSDA